MIFFDSFLEELKTASVGRVRNVTHDDIADFGHIPSLRSDKPWERKIVRAKNGDLAGFATYDPKENELKALWVNPKYRRQGVATKLLQSFSGRSLSGNVCVYLRVALPYFSGSLP